MDEVGVDGAILVSPYTQYRSPGPAAAFEPPKPAEPSADLPKLVALARHDNVVVKICGAGTLGHAKRLRQQAPALAVQRRMPPGVSTDLGCVLDRPAVHAGGRAHLAPVFVDEVVAAVDARQLGHVGPWCAY